MATADTKSAADEKAYDANGQYGDIYGGYVVDSSDHFSGLEKGKWIVFTATRSSSLARDESLSASTALFPLERGFTATSATATVLCRDSFPLVEEMFPHVAPGP